MPNDATSLAAIFHETGKPLELRNVALPSLLPGEAIVRISCCTVCGSDLHTVSGARTELTPTILGHEIVGVVAEVRDPPLPDVDGNPLAVGDRVTWSTAISCGACDRCRNGLPQKCRAVVKYGHALAEGRHTLSGGFAEHLLLRPGSAVVKLTETVPDEVVCPANCATATVAAAIRTAGSIDGKRVLIFGAGMLGLTAIAFAKTRGAAHITICDRDEVRLEVSKRFGADACITWETGREGFQQRLAKDEPSLFDVVLELSGSPDAVEAACALGDVGAEIVLVGSVMPSRSIAVDPESIVRRWLSIHGVHNYAPEDLKTAVAFLEAHHRDFPFADLVSHTYSLSDVNQAIEDARKNRPVRVAIRP